MAASGAVIMGYSMDQTVFFQTLEQYQYNPAMIIGGEVGEAIGASAAGIVTNIEETAQTGTTVTLDMGNGYTAVYGQLTDVPLAVGDYVNAGETVGNLTSLPDITAWKDQICIFRSSKTDHRWIR